MDSLIVVTEKVVAICWHRVHHVSAGDAWSSAQVLDTQVWKHVSKSEHVCSFSAQRECWTSKTKN